MIMMAKAILTATRHPEREDDSRLGLIGNSAACGAHKRIVHAIIKARSDGAKLTRRKSGLVLRPCPSAAPPSLMALLMASRTYGTRKGRGVSR